jgi:hypothetical protein
MPKYYIGYKMVSRDRGNYYGSSKLLLEDITNIGKRFFIKILLKKFNSDVEARMYETKLLTYFNARNNELFYNQTNGDVDFVAKPQHGKVCLRGAERTEKQKYGDTHKYDVRSDKRLKADARHSLHLKNIYDTEIREKILEGGRLWRESKEGKEHYSNIKVRYSVERKGKTKENDPGRQIASQKLKNNQNAKIGAVKLARMTDNNFQAYLSSISQHNSVQNQARTRRNKGIIYLQTGIWERYTKY